MTVDPIEWPSIYEKKAQQNDQIHWHGIVAIATDCRRIGQRE